MTIIFSLYLSSVCFEYLNILVLIFAYLPENRIKPGIIEGEEENFALICPIAVAAGPRRSNKIRKGRWRSILHFFRGPAPDLSVLFKFLH